MIKPITAIVALLSLSPISHASLIDRGNGMIYDTVLNITWLQDADYARTSMTWNDAVSWADQLVFGGYSDWRLPHALPVNGSTYIFDSNTWWDGTADIGYNITSPNSEMAHLYYVTLGNLGFFDIHGIFQPGFENQNWGPFINVWDPLGTGHPYYWTGSNYNIGDGGAFVFTMADGNQTAFPYSDRLGAWAVRDGDVVPIPAAVWLFGSGIVGLIGIAGVKRSA